MCTGTNKGALAHGTDPMGHATIRRRSYRTFFLCLFFRKRFLRLCVAILCLFLFLPHGMCFSCC